MGCRIGVATDVAARVRRLKQDGIVPSRATYTTIKSDLTYEDANALEIQLREACGRHCQGSPGDGPVPGQRWSFYRIEW